ncbi:hypothetical protein Bca52824_075498 [Brassica carinata]|uniref:Replication factor A C-terminal domain-containing protein n=1 Tax=Brassica carinata TaxID=52824 RepID=A0A8X7PPQ6_BRACI|nr:hypothetical protein Bca52824_075498 [Brassica carinata]
MKNYIGHIKLVNEQALGDGLVLDEVEIVSSRRILVHVQTHDGPVMKLYLWDTAATHFCLKFKAQENTPSVILALTNSSLSSSRSVLRPGRATNQRLSGLILYFKSRVAWFECTTTIDDVGHGLAWYYIACGGCKTKATKGPTTLMCKKCGKAEVAVLRANESVGDDAVVPVPQALIDTIGQTRKFVVKVSKHNLEGKTQALTVTKVLPLEVPVLEDVLDENVAEEPADGRDDVAGVTVKRSSDGIESGETKRAKCG